MQLLFTELVGAKVTDRAAAAVWKIEQETMSEEPFNWTTSETFTPRATAPVDPIK